MARYIPMTMTAIYLAREYLRTKLGEELKRGRITVGLGDMAADGSCPVYLRAEPEQFNLSEWFDVPQLDGTAWIEDVTPPAVRYELPGHLQPYTFLREHGAVE